MKYNFHVGDYVETINGFVGWIYRIRDDGYIWVTNKDIASCSYHIPEELKSFNRIGQYDFTEKDKGKIEPLAEEYTKSFPFYKTITTGNDSEWCGINFGVMGNKINELVKAVNKLRDKND